MFFKQKMLNQNNKKYFVKTIGYKHRIQYVTDGFTTIAIAKLISLNNIGPCAKYDFQLPYIYSCIWSYRKKLPIQCTITQRFTSTKQKIKFVFHCFQRQVSFVKILPPTQFLLSSQDFLLSFSIYPAAIKLFS